MTPTLTWGEAFGQRGDQRPVLERVEIRNRATGIPAALRDAAGARAAFLQRVKKSNPQTGEKRARSLSRLMTTARYGFGLAVAWFVVSRCGMPAGAAQSTIIALAGLAFGRGGPIRMAIWTKIWFVTFGMLSALLFARMRPDDPAWWASEVAFWQGGGSWSLSNGLVLLTSGLLWLGLGIPLCRAAGRLCSSAALEIAFIDGLRRDPYLAPRASKASATPSLPTVAADQPHIAGPVTPTGLAAFIGGAENLSEADAAAIAAQSAGSENLNFVTQDGEVITRPNPSAVAVEVQTPPTPAVIQAEPAPATMAPAAEREAPKFNPDTPAKANPLQPKVPAGGPMIAEPRANQLLAILESYREAKADRRERQLATMLRAQWRTWGPVDVDFIASQPDGPDLLELRTHLSPEAGGTRIQAPNIGKPFNVASVRRPPDAFEAAKERAPDADPEPVADVPETNTIDEAAAVGISEALTQLRRNVEARAKPADVAGPPTQSAQPAETSQPNEVKMAIGDTAGETDYRPFENRTPAPVVIEAEVLRPVQPQPEPQAPRVSPPPAEPATERRPAASGDDTLRIVKLLAGLFQDSMAYRRVTIITQALEAAGIDEAGLDAALDALAGIRDDIIDQVAKYRRLREMDSDLKNVEADIGQLELSIAELRSRPHNFYRDRGKIGEQIERLDASLSRAMAAGADTALSVRFSTARRVWAETARAINARDFAGLSAGTVTISEEGQVVADFAPVIDAIASFGRKPSRPARTRPQQPDTPAPRPRAPLLDRMQSSVDAVTAPPAPVMVATTAIEAPVEAKPVMDAAALAPMPPVVETAAVEAPAPDNASSSFEGRLESPASGDKKRRPDISGQKDDEAASSDVDKVPTSRFGEFYPAEVVVLFKAVHEAMVAARRLEGERASLLAAGENDKVTRQDSEARELRLKAGTTAAEARRVLARALRLADDAADAAFEERIAPVAFWAYRSYIAGPIERADLLRRGANEDDPQDSGGSKLQARSAAPKRFQRGEAPADLGERAKPRPVAVTPPTQPEILQCIRDAHGHKVGQRDASPFNLITVYDDEGRCYVNLCGYVYDPQDQALVNSDGKVLRAGTFRNLAQYDLVDPILLFTNEAERKSAPANLGEIRKSDSIEAIIARGKPL